MTFSTTNTCSELTKSTVCVSFAMCFIFFIAYLFRGGSLRSQKTCSQMLITVCILLNLVKLGNFDVEKIAQMGFTPASRRVLVDGNVT